MGLLDTLRDVFKSSTTRKTDETVKAAQAARRIMQSVSEEGATHSFEDVRTVDRVLSPALDWKEILRPPSDGNTRIRDGA